MNFGVVFAGLLKYGLNQKKNRGFMKLEQDGRKRLEAMKKALAAGLPLAGLLAAAGCSGGSPGLPGPTAGSVPCPPPAQEAPEMEPDTMTPPGKLVVSDESELGTGEEEFVTMGEIAIDELPPMPSPPDAPETEP